MIPLTWLLCFTAVTLADLGFGIAAVVVLILAWISQAGPAFRGSA